MSKTTLLKDTDIRQQIVNTAIDFGADEYINNDDGNCLEDVIEQLLSQYKNCPGCLGKTTGHTCNKDDHGTPGIGG